MRRQPRATESTSRNGQGGVYYVTHEWATPARLTATLAHAIADVADVDVTVAELAVGDRVDPAALDRLFSPSTGGQAGADLSFAFDLWGYAVTIRSDGTIAIRPPHTDPGQHSGRAGHGGTRPP